MKFIININTLLCKIYNYKLIINNKKIQALNRKMTNKKKNYINK